MDNYNEHVPKPEQVRNKKRRWLAPVLFGVIIGVLLTIIVVPIIMHFNFPSDRIEEASENPNDQESSQNRSSNTNRFVTVDVTTQITEVVEEVSPAVVGVTNIQRQADFWSQQNENEAGTGSGVIYKKEDGYAFVVTNQHVIEGADTVEV